MIKSIANLIVVLNGNLKKGQIAAGFSWGLLLGLVPVGNAFWIVLFVLSFCFRHHNGSKVLVIAVLKLLSFLVAPLMDEVGWELLHVDSLQPLFTSLYNMPFVPWTNFNNTLVAGGLASGIVLWLPVFFLIRAFVPLYRNKIAVKLKENKLVKSFKRIPLVSSLIKAVEKASDAKSAFE